MFIVAEASTLPDKLRSLSRNADRQIENLRRVAEGVNSYMMIKTATSFLTGLLVAIGLLLLGVDFALLWGLLAFLLNFIPTFGSIIAAVPAVGIALLQFAPDELWKPVVAAAWYLVVNMLISYLIEPNWMGRGMGMSALVVFVSLIFWGWVLGPVGMFISVPLTMTVQIALEASDDTRWLAVLLGSKSPELTESKASPT
jgi:predicted PurR-regulated permease PerM